MPAAAQLQAFSPLGLRRTQVPQRFSSLETSLFRGASQGKQPVAEMQKKLWRDQTRLQSAYSHAQVQSAADALQVGMRRLESSLLDYADELLCCVRWALSL